MGRKDRFWSMLVAGFAAWMLVLQSLSAAVAIGAPAAGHDAFGNVLCIGNPDDQAAHPGEAGDHRTCCALGCMLGGIAAPAPAGGEALAAPLDETAAEFRARDGQHPRGSAQPGLERSHAPPSAA
ncbi:MAG: hypothetical protein KF849_14490 [Rhizobiaceae bacterium]|nr:hypothetical protein [Rhizobiaceae bacterium]